MVGLTATTQSQAVVIGGIITIAIADALSDAFGVHISEESNPDNSDEQVWSSTISTFVFKLFFASTFIVPVLVFELKEAVLVSIIWGLFLLSAISVKIAKEQDEPIWKIVGEHIMIALVVIFLANFVGEFVVSVFV
ncbi:MAG: hypothetical protein ABIH20_06660 [Candidatus Diapherotrites archaeon]